MHITATGTDSIAHININQSRTCLTFTNVCVQKHMLILSQIDSTTLLSPIIDVVFLPHKLETGRFQNIIF